MKDRINLRQAQVLKEGVWKDIDFMEIRPGDTFRLYEPDGDSVKDSKGVKEFVAKKAPVVDSQGIEGIEVCWDD